MVQFRLKEYASSFFIGETSQGIESAVFFDPSFASMNNKSAASMISGAPGSGKTFFAQILCAQAAVAGKMVVVIDPKADFLSMESLKGDIGKISTIRLSNESRRGIIDPFVICGEDKTHGVMLAKEMISMLTNIKDLPSDVIDPIIADVAAQKHPSFTSVIEGLRAFKRKENDDLASRVRSIGRMLTTASELPFAKLMFSNPYKVPSRIPMGEGLNVITMLGIELPSADKPREDYTQADRVSTALMYLVTDYTYRVLQEDTKGIPKLLIIDEAWSVVQNSSGANIVKQVARLGRSLNMSLVLITQSASDVAGMDIDNAITTYFAFRANGREGNRIAELMGLRHPEEEQPRDWLALMQNLNDGECLMKDVRDRYCTVQISNYKRDWAEAFESNPIAKARKAREQEK